MCCRGPCPFLMRDPGSSLSSFRTKASGKGFAKIDGESAKGNECFGCGGFEDALHFGGDLGALLVTVHAEGAGEFVGDAQSFEENRLIQFSRRGCSTELVEKIEALADGGEIFLPKLGEDVV